MMRPCDVCKEPYVAKRATSRYCSVRCRTRASRAGGVPAVVSLQIDEPAVLGSVRGEVESATLAELVAAGRDGSALGQACLVLARRLDQPGTDTGSAVAAVAARLEGLLASATRGAGKASQAQVRRDELAERRAAHGA